MKTKFKVGQVIETPGGEGKVLKVSTYSDNKEEIDSNLLYSGWENETDRPMEDLIWYLVYDPCNEQIWMYEEELSEFQY